MSLNATIYIFKKIFCQKLWAALLHSIATIVVVSAIAALVFFVWYPMGLSQMLRGAELFKLVVLGEIILGPLLSFIVYSPLKSKAELVKDYGVIVAVQLMALGYGVCSVANSRPVYMVFVKDRVEVVTSFEYQQSDLAAGGLSRLGLPMSGPLVVCSEMPQLHEERQNLMFAALEGRDLHMQPKYYRDCRDGEILSAASDGHELVALLNGGLDRGISLPDEFVWLPLHSRYGVWVIIYPKDSQEEYWYLDVDPYELTSNAKL